MSATYSGPGPDGFLQECCHVILLKPFEGALFSFFKDFLANFVQFFRKSLKLRQSFVANAPVNKYLAAVRKTAHIHIKGRFNYPLQVDRTFTKNINFLCIC